MIPIRGFTIGKTKTFARGTIKEKRKTDGKRKSLIPLPPVIAIITKVEMKFFKPIVIIKWILIHFPDSTV